MSKILKSIAFLLSVAALASAGLLVYFGLPDDAGGAFDMQLKPWLLCAAVLAFFYFLLVNPLTSGLFGVRGKLIKSFLLQTVLVSLGVGCLYLTYKDLQTLQAATKTERAETISEQSSLDLTRLTDEQKAKVEEEIQAGMMISYFCRSYGPEFSEYYEGFLSIYRLYYPTFLVEPDDYSSEKAAAVDAHIEGYEARIKSLYDKDPSQVFPDEYGNEADRSLYCKIVAKQISDRLHNDWKAPKVVKGVLD